MATSEQWDFGAGIYRGREAPENAAYDLLNCLLDDEGQPFRRGGSAYFRSAIAGAVPLLGLAPLYLTATGERSLTWTTGKLFEFTAAGVPAEVKFATGFTASLKSARVATDGAHVLIPGLQDQVLVYGGSQKNASVSGSATTTNGSKVVTGAATTWLSNADAGMLFTSVNATGPRNEYIVGSIDSNTQLTLLESFVGTSGAALYELAPTGKLTVPAPNAGKPLYVAAVGSPARLLICAGNRVLFSEAGNPYTLDDVSGEYHELPTGGIVGADGIRDTAVIFTLEGMWGISNMAFDAIDDVGNVQHQVTRLNEIILWGDPGVAKWRGAMVVPAVDGLWLVPLGAEPILIGEGVKPLYLSYVKAGYQPGIAVTHRGHYFLPILNGTTLVDMLVCRLDRGFAWTRWAGHGAGIAYAQRIGASTRSPKLLSISGQRVTELTDAWSPSSSNASEADATTHTLTIETRDLPTPGGAAGSTTRKVKVRYQATGTATFTVSYARGPEDATYTSLGTATRGGSTSDGLDESVWPVNKRAPAIRFRITSTSALSTFTLRGIEAHYTPRGTNG